MNYQNTLSPILLCKDGSNATDHHARSAIGDTRSSIESFNNAEVCFTKSCCQDCLHQGNTTLVRESPSLGKGKLKPCLSKRAKSRSTVKYQGQSLQVLTISAKSGLSLRSILHDLYTWVSSQQESGFHLGDLAYTFASRRSLMPWRYGLIAGNQEELLLSLQSKTKRVDRVPNVSQIVFIFTGQGAQWHAMGRELLHMQCSFTESICTSTTILQDLGAQWNLLDELLLDKPTSRVNVSEVGHPATTAIQIALVDILRQWNITPTAVLGHSSGEIAAAYAAGAISHKTAIRLSYHRGALSKLCNRKLNVKGAMLAIALGERDVVKYLSQLKNGRIVIACVNSPLNTTVAGDEEAISEFEKTCADLSIKATRLQVDTAYHSHHMEAVASEYRDALGNLESELTAPQPSIGFFSSVTTARKLSMFDTPYFVENLTSKVRFSEALLELVRESATNPQAPITPEHLLIEIGPHSALANSIHQTLAQSILTHLKYTYQPTLVRNCSAERTLLELGARLFELGHPIKINAVNDIENLNVPCTVVESLMPYPWDRSQTHWYEPRLSTAHRLRRFPPHDLLGQRIIASTTLEPLWSHSLTSDELPWLKDHRVDDVAIFPASGFLSMAVEAVQQIAQERGIPGTIKKFVLQDISFSKALVIPDPPTKLETQLSLRSNKIVGEESASDCEIFRIFSIDPDGMCKEHCSGFIKLELAPSSNNETTKVENVSIARAIDDRLAKDKDEDIIEFKPPDLYQRLKLNGNCYGPSFAAIKSMKVCKSDAFSTVRIPDVVQSMPAQFMQPHVIHPATLDAVIHTSLVLYMQHRAASSILTTAIRELAIAADIDNVPGKEFQVATTISPHSSSATVDVSVYQQTFTSQARKVIQITEVKLQETGTKASIPESLSDHDIAYRIRWGRDSDFFTPLSLTNSQEEAKNSGLTPCEKLQLLNDAASFYIESSLDQVSMQRPSELKGHWPLLFDWMQHYHKSKHSQHRINEISRLNKDACLQKAQEAGVEGEMLCRIGSQLTSFFGGIRDPLSTMLEGDLLHRLYADDSSSRCYSHLATYMENLLFNQPHLNVLEIGGGTGGATVPLFRSMSQHESFVLNRYDFTDISPGFLDVARSQLKEWETLIEYKVLDIARDPIVQGFIEASYDVIIASNALHVVSQIDDGLRHARRLLKPGGKLLLIEIVQWKPFLNVIFGVLPGWWAGEQCPI